MTKKINSKLLISICLVAILIVCALSMMACNKNKGNSSNNSDIDVVTGETIISIDNITENKTINIPSEYTVISPNASYVVENIITTNSGREFWIIKDGTTSTVQGTSEVLENYFIYDLLGDKKIGPFTTYAIASKNYSGGYTYKYIYTATILFKQNEIYKYIGQVMDVYGKFLTTSLNGDSNSLRTGVQDVAFFGPVYLDFASRVNISDDKSVDAQFGAYTTATFVDSNGVSSTQMISLSNFEIQPLDSDDLIPTFDAGNTYQEKTPVPDMNGYYYVVDRSKNTIFFYNSYASTTPISSLLFDFGDLGMSFDEDCIQGGKVVLYGEAALPATAEDFDYYSTDDLFGALFYTIKTKNAMYVFDIKSGEMNRILQGFVIDKKFNLFTANNGNLYISVKLNKIFDDKTPSATSRYYIADTEGNILVSTPDLFDPARIQVKFSNGGYAYYLEDENHNPTHLYILDKYLNTTTKADYLWTSQNNAFLVTDDSLRIYAVDLSGTIKNTNLNANDFIHLDMVGDYIIAELYDGKLISYAIGNADSRLIFDPATSTDTTMKYISNGVYIKIQEVSTTYTISFINCNGNQIGDSITGLTSSAYNVTLLDTGLIIKVGNNYYYIS